MLLKTKEMLDAFRLTSFLSVTSAIARRRVGRPVGGLVGMDLLPVPLESSQFRNREEAIHSKFVKIGLEITASN